MTKGHDVIPVRREPNVCRAATSLSFLLTTWCCGSAALAQTAFPTRELPANEWQQISVPGVLPASVSTLETVLGDDFSGAEYETDRAVYALDNVADSYRMIGLDETIESGRECWIIQSTGTSRALDVPPGTAEPNAGAADTTRFAVPYRRIDLNGNDSGINWHMVSRPGALTTQVSDLRVAGSPGPPCPPRTPCPLPQAFAADLTDERLYAYNASNDDYLRFEENAELPLWKRFWLGSRASAGVGAPTLLPPVMALPAAAFKDEFDGDALAGWSLRHQVKGSTAQHVRLDVGRTTSGALTIERLRTPGWFADGDAPLVFKLVSRDNLSVETNVRAESVASPDLSSTSNFNSAGLMARDSDDATGPENYVIVNVGSQDGRIAGSVGSEAKTTVNSRPTLRQRAGSNQEHLALCRVGYVITAYRWLDKESGWSEIARYSRPDLPATLQVGMIANGFGGPDLRATYGCGCRTGSRTVSAELRAVPEPRRRPGTRSLASPHASRG